MNRTRPHTPLAVAGLRVLLLDHGQRRSPVFRAELIRLRCQLVEVLEAAADLPEAVARREPDLIIIDSPDPDAALLQRIATAQAERHSPVVLFAEGAGPETMRDALQVGINVVIVGGLQPQRFESVLQLTLARFEQDEHLRTELARVQTQLADRKSIERAKGILMREQHLDEDTAYHRLRRLAMGRGEPLASVASRLLEADQLLRKA